MPLGYPNVVRTMPLGYPKVVYMPVSVPKVVYMPSRYYGGYPCPVLWWVSLPGTMVGFTYPGT